MLAWQANMDIQFVLNAYACIMYVASYIMKTERSMGELLKRVAAEARTDELRTQLRKVGLAFLTHRDVSAQEAEFWGSSHTNFPGVRAEGCTEIIEGR